MKLKKPKFWDYKKPNFTSNLLYPLSKIYELVLNLRPYNKRKVQNIKTICVGNIYLGGTGKTSFAIELKKILEEKKLKVCFIKKYYSDQLDEQKLLNNFGKTFVDESRLKALKKARDENYEIAIFDDGLQDKSIDYDLSFVCFNKKNMCGNGRMLPSGPLRENLSNLKMYQNVIFIGNEDKSLFQNILLKDYVNLNFYDASYQITNLNNFDLNDTFTIFSGIGNHDTFREMLIINKFNIIHDLEFADHYNYLKKDMDNIFDLAKANKSKILTTEKDYLRLDENYKKNIDFVKISLKIKQIEELKNKLNFRYENF